jgi:hypothetical protein
MGRACSKHGEKKNTYKISMEKLQGIKLLRSRSCRWEDNIKMDQREIRWSGMDLIYLAQSMDQWNALVNIVMNIQVP